MNLGTEQSFQSALNALGKMQAISSIPMMDFIMVMSKYLIPDLSRSALITIDTQQDALDGQPFEIPGTSAILSNMVDLLRAFRRSGLLIVHVVRIYMQDGSNVDLCRRELIEKGTKLLLAGSAGCQLAGALVPEGAAHLNTELLLGGGIQELCPKEVVIYKPRWGAFFETPLMEYLREQGVSTLVFTGSNFPNCPRTSIYEASERDFRIILVEDAVSGLYARGRDEIKGIGVAIRSTDELLKELNKTQPSRTSE